MDDEENEVNQNVIEATSIQAIDKQAVHRICSGQVVLNLATAVKELVENSLDAGANTIEVRLKEYGSELLEVVDNGIGVKKNNFEGLTLKHHTSKLRDFSDLTSVDTFGFRGEALSSLCALSHLIVTTCHKNDQVGSKLEYDHGGKLLSTTPCARQTGTTVSLQNLFSTLPVRHKEFHRNLKKEFNKMVQVLNAYGIISKKVKLSCTNQVGKGKKNVIVNINDNETMKENITNIFGPKQMQNLIEFTQHDPGEEEQAEYKLEKTNHKIYNIQGYISTCEHGKGRSATDRQFLFVNKRPCDLVKVSRVVNEVYHMYNRHQYPFVVLDISLDKDSVDVNVTPDKRQIFVENEKLLLATIKTSLLKLFEPHASVYTVNPGIQKSLSSLSVFTKDARTSLKSYNSSPASLLQKQVSGTSNTPNLTNLKRNFASAFAKTLPLEGQNDDHNSDGTNEQQAKQRKLDMFVVKSQREKQDFEDKTCESTTENMSYKLVFEEMGDLSNNSVNNITNSADENDLNKSTETILLEDKRTSDWCQSPSVISLDNDYPGKPHHFIGNNTIDVSNTGDCNLSNISTNTVNKDCDSEQLDTDTDIKPSYGIVNEEIDIICKTKTFGAVIDKEKDADIELSHNVSIEHSKDKLTGENEGYAITVTELDEVSKCIKRKEVKLSFSFSKLKDRIKRKQERSQVTDDQLWCRAFRAKITPGDNKSAEDELQKQISKSMFPDMEILGQFNLGFIIGKLKQDLFIIDQHATDEKYNFEMLQRHTVIQSQKLIQPQTMELTAANETILMDNLDVFQKNGFDFKIIEEALPTQRVRLVSMPVSKNWTFGKEDIEELIFMLSDSPGVMCRPSRVRMMFASRACRKSIMIGTHLNKAEMKKLVHHMSEIEQPWNCPHGRPTMRHLINLDMLPT